MSFRFRLEKVQRHRQRVVDQQGAVVATANRQVIAVRTRLEAVRRDLARYLEGGNPAGEPVVSVQSLISRSHWVEHLENVQREIQAELVEAHQILAAEQTLLSQLWRNVEVLKNLREQQYESWREQQLRQERKTLDEIGQIRSERLRRSIIAT